jgi:hypothetical protein
LEIVEGVIDGRYPEKPIEPLASDAGEDDTVARPQVRNAPNREWSKKHLISPIDTCWILRRKGGDLELERAVLKKDNEVVATEATQTLLRDCATVQRRLVLPANV